MDEDVLESWYKRAEKKGPYYYFGTTPLTGWAATRYPNGHKHWIIWQETVKGKVKTKLAVAEDGLCARYGFDVWAVLTGSSVTGLWQASANIVTEPQLQALLDVANGRIKLPKFDIRNLTDVTW